MSKIDWNKLTLVESRKPKPDSSDTLSEKERIEAICALILKAYRRHRNQLAKKGRD
ncbi:MAG: hypothetical protein AB7F43_02025 [Bacteriovoracia bacterium]